MSQKSDFLVIGGGIAGLTFALEAAKSGSVTVLSKRSITDTSTSWAQGGIAAVEGEDDNVDLHIEDTLRAGDGLSNYKIVNITVNEGVERVKDLIANGVQFDSSEDKKNYDLHQEGGHSRRRIFHSGDATGWEIQRALLEKVKKNKNIKLIPNANAIDLITTHKLKINREEQNSALGMYVLLENGEVLPFLAKKILVATGGAGKIYLYTSNPDVATGDGIAICFRAGAAVANMEFFQFHPTCLYHPKAKTFLITEAMRGEGAYLKRIDGTRFMEKYDPRMELASRDVVARAIDSELKATGDEFVLLDISHKPSDFIKSHFPTIYEECLKYGIDITKEPIPVVPAAHYSCGGVVVDENGCTSIKNLYVAGEAACTGLHGANRLASNSLLEGVVFGHRSAVHASNTIKEKAIEFIPPSWERGRAVASNEEVVITHTWDEIRRLMWNYVGIVRSDKRLDMALRRCELISKEINDYYWNYLVTSDLLELRNICLVSQLVIDSALRRKESRGLHYMLDHQGKDPAYAKNTVIEPEEWFHYLGRW